MRDLAQHWAAADPQNAERWAASLANVPERDSCLIHVCLKVADRNSAEAIDLAERNQLGGGLMENLAHQWANRDFNSAIVWANSRPAGVERDRFFARMTIARAAVAPEEAAKLVSAKIPLGPIQEAAALSVIHQWAISDRKNASAWAALFPEGQLRDRALSELRQRPAESATSSTQE